MNKLNKLHISALTLALSGCAVQQSTPANLQGAGTTTAAPVPVIVAPVPVLPTDRVPNAETMACFRIVDSPASVLVTNVKQAICRAGIVVRVTVNGVYSDVFGGAAGIYVEGENSSAMQAVNVRKSPGLVLEASIDGLSFYQVYPKVGE